MPLYPARIVVPEPANHSTGATPKVRVRNRECTKHSSGRGGAVVLRERNRPNRTHGPASSEVGPFTFPIILFPVSSILGQF